MVSLAFYLPSFLRDAETSSHSEKAEAETAFTAFKKKVVKAAESIFCCLGEKEAAIPVSLHQACQKGDLILAREWMKKGADPYVPDHYGKTPLDYAKDNLALLKILTRTENHRAFLHCRTIHDFWAVVYSTPVKILSDKYREVPLPENHKELMLKVPMWSIQSVFSKPEDGEKMPSITDLARGLKDEEERTYEMMKKTTSTAPPRESYTLPLERVIAYLREHHPLIDTALKHAGEPKIEKATFSGPRFHAAGESAAYHSQSNTIFVEGEAGYEKMIYAAVFELMNALGRETFQKIEELSASGALSREEATFLVEALEFKSLVALTVIFPERKDNPANTDFYVRWVINNSPLQKGLLSHADFTRFKWDSVYAIPYLLKHRTNFEKRIEELR